MEGLIPGFKKKQTPQSYVLVSISSSKENQRKERKMLSLFLSLYLRLYRLFVKRENLPFIHLQSGNRFVHQWPLTEDVSIEDIANNLSKICRYCGSVEGDNTIYSVAEHCVRASYIDPENFPLEKLLHDGAEAYVQDLPRPLKYSPFMWVYKYYEKLAEKVVAEKFKLNTGNFANIFVKHADKIMLVTEKRDLFAQDRVMCLNKMDDAEGIPGLPEKIVPWSPEQAKRAFLMRFYELTGQETFYRSEMSIEDMEREALDTYIRFYLSTIPSSCTIITNVQLPASDISEGIQPHFD